MPNPHLLAIGLGSNLPGQAGSPLSTLIAVRPKIEKIIADWVESTLKETKAVPKKQTSLQWKWSPLFETEPLGGPKKQNAFINAALVVDGSDMKQLTPSENSALQLLQELLILEKHFGRDRNTEQIRWGPRTLDIDILAWGDLQVKSPRLTIPHPRLIERSFVLIPLGEAISYKQKPPKKIRPLKGWPE